MYKASISHMSEKEAIQLFRKGDNQGLAFLYQLYYQNLLLSAYYYMKSKESSEDVVSDVFKRMAEMSAGDRQKRIDQNTIHLESFLKTVVRNRCLDELKVQKNRFRIEKGIFESSSRYDCVDEYKLDQERFKEKVGKDDLKLYDLQAEGFSLSEIAELTNFKIQTVKNKITNVRSKLRAAWRKQH